ncbi:MAG: hypothetical protein H6917_08925 [Novosphingobium sp.]|nr:hypothetical protein [Novosphingobium sp.]MCP5402498.1 hypothetical protein [Novosphingobium sp.]
MYRHFAVATIAITICLAIFADGEYRDVLDQRQAENETLQAERAREGQKKLAANGLRMRDGRSTQGSFGADPGMPVDTQINYSSGSNAPPRRPAHGSLEPPAPSEREIGVAYDTPDVLPPDMSEEEMRRFILLKKGEKAKKRSTSSELDTLVAASRNRSGAENDDED